MSSINLEQDHFGEDNDAEEASRLSGALRHTKYRDSLMANSFRNEIDKSFNTISKSPSNKLNGRKTTP